VAGALVLFEYFFSNTSSLVTGWSIMVQNWGTSVSAFAACVAVANLMFVHAKRAQQRQADSWISAIVLVSMAAMTIVSVAGESTRHAYDFLFQSMYKTLGSAILSLTIFFIASAARRAFIARNADAAFLLLAGTLVILGNAPVGAVISPIFPSLADWLAKYPNVAGNRAMIIAASLGMAATSLRSLLGIDRSYLGGSES